MKINNHHRLVRNPDQGKIVAITQLGDLDICTYENGSISEIRVLMPENPIKVKSITITRDEGPIALCGKPVTLLPETHEDGMYINPIIKATCLFKRWGGPKKGEGYDKCSFKIVWDDEAETSYEGRFNLQDGCESGKSFGDSLKGRIFWYAGLSGSDDAMEEISYRYLIKGQEAFALKLLKDYEF